LKEERGSLWIRVLPAKYGEEGGDISEGGRFASFIFLLESLLFGFFFISCTDGLFVYVTVAFFC